MQVLSVADVFVALASEWPNRPALFWAEAVERLVCDVAGGEFDPVIVPLFRRLVERSDGRLPGG